MTPRQLAGYFHLARRRWRIEQAELLHHMAMAFRATEGKDLQRLHNEILLDAE